MVLISSQKTLPVHFLYKSSNRDQKHQKIEKYILFSPFFEKTDSDFNYKAFCTCEITLQPFIKWFLFDKITIHIIFVEKAWKFMKFLPE